MGLPMPEACLESHSARRWYALQVRPCAEFSTEKHLERAGLKPFLPSIETVSRWSDRKKIIRRPLFPGYLFAHFDPDQDSVFLPGVISILGFGRDPMPVPDSEIASVRQLLDSPLPIHAVPVPAIGRQIEVKRGPLAGATGIMAGTKDSKNGMRLVVSIEILNRAVSVQVDPEWVA